MAMLDVLSCWLGSTHMKFGLSWRDQHWSFITWFTVVRALSHTFSALPSCQILRWLHESHLLPRTHHL